MDATLLDKMKEIIGCEELTHEILDEYIRSGGWWERKLLPWEHCAMRFQEVCYPMNRMSLQDGIYLCRYNDKPYFFGLGLKEPVVTEYMLRTGTWLVYTWSD